MTGSQISQSESVCDSQSGSGSASQTGVAPGTPTYGTDGTDGESGCEGGNLSGVDAHDTRPPTLAYHAPCRYCGRPVYVALCRDGRWRTFETATVPTAPAGVWAWRKTWGMEEQELVPGHVLHFCAEYTRARPEEVLPR